MKFIINILPLFLFIFLTEKKVEAQIKQLSVNEITEIALKNNLKIQADNMNMEAAEKQKKSVFELPKTDVNFQVGQYNSIHHDKAFQINQRIPFPTYFGAKSGVFEAEIKSNELQKAITENEIKAQVKSYYYQLVYLKNTQKQLLMLDSLFLSFVKSAESRYNTGETNLLEKTTFETKSGQYSLMLQQNEIEINKMYASLKSLMNYKQDFEINDEVFEPINDEFSKDSGNVSNNPSIKFSYQKAVIISQNKRLERAQTLPDLTIGYFNQSMIGNQTINGNEVYFDGSKRFVGFNFGLGIPLTFFSNNAKIKSLDLKQNALLKQAHYETIILKNELDNAQRQYEKNVLQYEYYKKSAKPNADIIIKTAKANFNNGNIGYVEYLQALQTASDIQLNYLQSINDINQSIIQINYLNGK